MPRFLLCAVVALIASAPRAGILAQRPAGTAPASPQISVDEFARIADDVASGRTVPNDFALSWTRVDAMKAQGGNELVPFTVTIEPPPPAGRPLTLFWRVIARTGAAPGSTVYQSASVVPAVSSGPSPLRVSRAFLAPAGDYDVIVVVRESAAADSPNAARTAALSRPVTVPDFWNGGLTTSSVMLASRLDPLPAPVARQLPLEHPYSLGGLELVPAWEASFTRKAEVLPFFLIYNAGLDAANKPDLLIEYRFYTVGDQQALFNTAQPQELNGRTLPPQFDPATYQLQAGEGFPLASFPPGRYRLEMTITDRVARQSIVRDVMFSITQ
jgi:hypothetical protein